VFIAHAERRYARQASRELLELYGREHREHPELTGRSLYVAVVARRLGPDATNARMSSCAPRRASPIGRWSGS